MTGSSMPAGEHWGRSAALEEWDPKAFAGQGCARVVLGQQEIFLCSLVKASVQAYCSWTLPSAGLSTTGGG